MNISAKRNVVVFEARCRLSLSILDFLVHHHDEENDVVCVYVGFRLRPARREMPVEQRHTDEGSTGS